MRNKAYLELLYPLPSSRSRLVSRLPPRYLIFRQFFTYRDVFGESPALSSPILTGLLLRRGTPIHASRPLNCEWLLSILFLDTPHPSEAPPPIPHTSRRTFPRSQPTLRPFRGVPRS